MALTPSADGMPCVPSITVMPDNLMLIFNPNAPPREIPRYEIEEWCTHPIDCPAHTVANDDSSPALTAASDGDLRKEMQGQRRWLRTVVPCEFNNLTQFEADRSNRHIGNRLVLCIKYHTCKGVVDDTCESFSDELPLQFFALASDTS